MMALSTSTGICARNCVQKKTLSFDVTSDAVVKFETSHAMLVRAASASHRPEWVPTGQRYLCITYFHAIFNHNSPQIFLMLQNWYQFNIRAQISLPVKVWTTTKRYSRIVLWLPLKLPIWLVIVPDVAWRWANTYRNRCRPGRMDFCTDAYLYNRRLIESNIRTTFIVVPYSNITPRYFSARANSHTRSCQFIFFFVQSTFVPSSAYSIFSCCWLYFASTFIFFIASDFSVYRLDHIVMSIIKLK